jgi:hypothetical protein
MRVMIYTVKVYETAAEENDIKHNRLIQNLSKPHPNPPLKTGEGVFSSQAQNSMNLAAFGLFSP